MTTKMMNPAYKLLLGCFALALTVAACNNSADDKKEKAADTPAVKPVETVAPTTIDTSKMDTATTRPVKTAD